MFYNSGDTEEDVDFNVTSTSSSKLANLFSFEQTNKEQSLTYTAPKQPKKSGVDEPKNAATASAPSVTCAVVVHAFKFENQQYVSQGKLGAAIIVNHDSPSYKLVLYKGKQVHVAFATITISFVLKVQANNYRSFYDDQRDSWSILFDIEQNALDFAKQVAVARANSAGNSLNCVVVQDLNFGDETKGLESGDAAEVKYSGWLLQNHTFGQLFDSNNQSDKTMKIKIGKTKIIKGWEEGMIGMKCNQKRVLIIPPILGYGNQEVSDKVPANSTLMFEVLVTKIKLAKDPVGSSTPSLNVEQKESLFVKKSDSSKIEPSSNATVSTDDSVKARGASISEQLSQSPKTEKAKIISRMAKMGTPMLPMQGSSTVQQSSESETEDDQTRRSLTSSPAREPSPKPIIKHRPRNPSHNIYTEPQSIHPAMPQNVIPQQQISVYQQQYPNAATLPYSYPFQATQPMAAVFQHPMAPLAPAPPNSLNDTHLPVLMSESRAQNSEVRMVLSKIGDKVDLVLNKLDQVKPSVPVINQPLLPYMDSTALVQNIERVVQENTRWKNDLEDKNQKIQALNEKICVLLEKNQKLVEESNVMMERRSDSFQSSTAQSQLRLANQEKEKVILLGELAVASSQIADLKLQLQKSHNEVLHKSESQSSNFEKVRDEMEKLKKELHEKNELVKHLESSLHATETAKLSFINKSENLQQELLSVQSSNDSLSKDVAKSKNHLEQKDIDADEKIQRMQQKYQEEIKLLKERIIEESNKLKESHVDDVIPDNWKEEKLSLIKDFDSSLEQIKELETQKLKLELEINSLTSTPNRSNWEAKLKRAMTALYRSLQQEIEGETSYDGGEILQLVLQSIRSVTSAMLENESTDSDVPKTNISSTGENSESMKRESLNEVDKTNNEENSATNVAEEIVPNEENLSKKESFVKEVSATEKVSTDVKNTIGNEMKPSTVKVDSLLQSPLSPSLEADDPKKKYLFFDTKTKTWRPQPPPPPLFDEDDDEDEDDWLKN